MLSLALASLFFFGIHALISGTPLRARIVGRIGRQPYLGLFSLLSLAGLVWMSRAYAQAGMVALWGPLDPLRPVALVVLLVAFLLVALALTTPSPTSLGSEALLERGDAARGILRITRHPLLWGIAIWAVMHLALNGDLASLVFFGTLCALAVRGTFSIDRKRARDFGEAWARFGAATSSLPFAAVIQGRNRLALAELGWWRLVLGGALYAGALWAHAPVFGARPW